MIETYFNKIESVFRRNLETRYMDQIHLPEMFSASVKSLLKAKHVVIVTGFVVKEAMAGETDGPPGALALAKALEDVGKTVTIVTDPINSEILHRGRDFLDLASKVLIMTNDNYKKESNLLLEKDDLTHLIAIERPSQASDGAYYSMRGEVLTPYVSNTDYLFHKAKLHGIETIGIGDGGNEIGMAIVKKDIEAYVPKGKQICATTEVDFLIIAGVSNWGAYGICGALSIELKKNLLPENQVEKKLLEEIVSVGAVDGFAKIPIMKVDGIDLEGNLKILSEIRELVRKHI